MLARSIARSRSPSADEAGWHPAETPSGVRMSQATKKNAAACGVIRERVNSARNGIRARILEHLWKMADAEERGSDRAAVQHARALRGLSIALEDHLSDNGL